MEWDKVSAFLVFAPNTSELSRICSALYVPQGGIKEEKADRILRKISSWQQLVEVMTVDMLKGACEIYGLSTAGTKADLSSRLEQFIEASPAQLLADPPFDGLGGNRSRGETVEHARAGWGYTTHGEPLEEILPATKENVLGVLSVLRLSGRIRDEYDAQEQVFARLGARFGDEAVGREMAIGGYTFTSIDIDIAKTYGIEVKHTDSLIKFARGHAIEVERLLGQIVLYRKHYRAENIVVVVAGNLQPTQRAPLAEIRMLIQEQGSSLVHLPSA